jgi:hypothetical protein
LLRFGFAFVILCEAQLDWFGGRMTCSRHQPKRLFRFSSALALCLLAAQLHSEEPAQSFWAFQPPQAAPIPQVRSSDWPQNPIDHFILAKLEEAGLRPGPPATKRELIRRVTFDLTGLPPTPEETDAFTADLSPDAFARVVDRLLASPSYGEGWGQHWLDVVRYAETEGFEYDRALPDGWRFRDYVIDSLNQDKPYDAFVAEQVAGDELRPDDPVARVAAGFHRLGAVRRNAGNAEIALSRNEVLTERTDIIGAAFLGLTIGCARCHDHKFDPISQRDYYQLQAFMAATSDQDIVLANDAEKALWQERNQQYTNELAQLKKQSSQAEGAARTALLEKIEELEDKMTATLPTITTIHNDAAGRTPIHILKRGVWEQKGEQVGPRPPSALVPADEPSAPAELEQPRTQLARWLTCSDNPLTARVMVNRLWQYHFGTGLVKTPNDFGRNGSRPSHPELLDYLALKLAENGWRLKPIHRLILLSSVYQQSATAPDASLAERIDPENRLLSHFQRRRLSAEELRDAMLAVSGRLNARCGGPSVVPHVDQQLVKLLYKPSQWEVTSIQSEHDRRSIYLFAKRNLRLPFMEVFDQPSSQTSCARRESGTHAPQALELLNGETANRLAHALAQRLQGEAGADRAALIERAFVLATGRPPSAQEKQLGLGFVDASPLEEFTLAVFNLNGFLYVQ